MSVPVAAIALAALASVPVPVAGQSAASATKAKAKAPAKIWTQPRTAWGDPDIQGVWPATDMNGTPLQRDPSLGTRAFLTEEEFAKRAAHFDQQVQIDTAEYASHDPLIARGDSFATCEQDKERCRDGVRIGPPNYWDERGKPQKQASLVVDPPDGRIPPLTAQAHKLVAYRNAARRSCPCASSAVGCHDSWMDESLMDRCITRGAVDSILPGGYNRGNQIVQSPGYVALRNEMIHETRIIPVDGRPHAPGNIRTWMGDSRGHWEGNTLVVETTNFSGHAPIGGSPTSDALRVVERFTRADANTLNYEVLVDDPQTWTKPWKIAFPMKNDPQYQLYEYACHEGNYYMRNALSGARSLENGQSAQKK
jgi:hypothetical protein